MSSKDYIQFQR